MFGKQRRRSIVTANEPLDRMETSFRIRSFWLQTLENIFGEAEETFWETLLRNFMEKEGLDKDSLLKSRNVSFGRNH